MHWVQCFFVADFLECWLSDGCTQFSNSRSCYAAEPGQVWIQRQLWVCFCIAWCQSAAVSICVIVCELSNQIKLNQIYLWHKQTGNFVRFLNVCITVKCSRMARCVLQKLLFGCSSTVTKASYWRVLVFSVCIWCVSAATCWSQISCDADTAHLIRSLRVQSME